MSSRETIAQSKTPARKRRSRAQVEALLCAAAEDIFAERGFHGATTKEIAERAGVSETLLFKYYVSKEGIFDAVVAQPFQALLDEFTQNLATQSFSVENNDLFVTQVHELAAKNKTLLRAYVLHAMALNGKANRLHGFDHYFAIAVSQLEKQYRKAGRRPDVDLEVAVRLGFALIVTSVLADGWLFAGSKAKKSAVRETLQKMITKSLEPTQRRS